MEEILKFVGVFVSIFAIYKVVVDVVLAHSSRRRDEYAFAKQYVSDVYNGGEHRYTLEKGFFALTGKLYSIEEIKLLLSQSTPSFLISQRGKIGSFIMFSEETYKYNWTEKYSNVFVRKHASIFFLICYIVTASLALMPIYIQGMSILANLPVFTFTLSLFVISIFSLVQHSNFDIAIGFMESIKYHNA